MAVTARRQPRIDVEALCRLPSFYVPRVSWSRDRVAFYSDRTGRMELYVLDLRTRQLRQVSHGEVPRALRTLFTWSRDGRFIAFGKDRDGDEQHDLYRIEVETGRLTQLSHDPAAEEHAVEFGPADAWLTVNTNKRLPETLDRPGQMNVWRMRVDGTAYQPVTRFAFPASGGQWSPDGRWLSVVGNEEADNLLNRDGYVVHPDGSGLRKVLSVRPGSQDRMVDWHADSRRVAVVSDAWGQNRVGILDVENGEVRWVSPPDADEGWEPTLMGTGACFSRDGRFLVALANHESQIRPVLYEVSSGARRELEIPDGVSYRVQFVLGDSHLLLAHSSSARRPSLLLYNLATDTAETILAPAYGTIDPALFVEAEHVTYESFDGTGIPALLYRPREIQPGERLPALVFVHGGPTYQWYRQFDPYAQFLADRGLVVLAPNIRGSTGYGVPFRDAALKDWGGADLEDVARAAAYLRRLPDVDPDRLAVFGGSYGGYMTFLAVTKKPDLWKAAVAWVGISDLGRMHQESREHFRYFLAEQMGDPVKDAELWADRSAVNFAHNLKARLLIVHGVNDPRCPISQSRLFRQRLLELGRREGQDFEYVELTEEGHGSADPDQKVRTFSLLADFLDRAL